MYNSEIQYQLQSNTNGRATVSSVIRDNLTDARLFYIQEMLNVQPSDCESMERQLSTIPELTEKVSLTSNKRNKSFQERCH